jgi:hypothetical protein
MASEKERVISSNDGENNGVRGRVGNLYDDIFTDENERKSTKPSDGRPCPIFRPKSQSYTQIAPCMRLCVGWRDHYTT